MQCCFPLRERAILPSILVLVATKRMSGLLEPCCTCWESAACSVSCSHFAGNHLTVAAQVDGIRPWLASQADS